MDATTVLRKSVAYLRQKVNPEMSLNQLAVFLEVVNDEGIIQNDIAKHLDMVQPSVSRNCLKLGTRGRKDEDGTIEIYGMGLLENKDDIIDPRRKAVWLTDKGKQVVSDLNKLSRRV